MTTPKSGKAKSRLVGLGILLCLAAVLYAAWRFWPKNPIAVKGIKPQVGVVRDVVSSSVAGEVTPESRALVRADLAAKVVAVLHKSGARVKKGELVVKLDSADLDARVAQAQAAASAVAGQVAQAEARLALLGRQAERARVLLARGAGTAQLSEDAEAAVREANQAIRAAKGQLEQAHAAAQVARVARSHVEIVAPFAGLLTEVLPNVGEVLAPAAPVFQIIDDSRLHVDATIDEADSAKVAIGQPAELKLDALVDRLVLIRGKVSKVEPAVKRDLKGARILGVEVEVQDVNKAVTQGLKPGMSANVEIVVAEKQNVRYLPSNVIIGRGVNRSVFLLAPDGKFYRVKKTDVQVGLSNWDRTEILSGVNDGDVVLGSLNQKGVEEGTLVKIQPDDAQGSK